MTILLSLFCYRDDQMLLNSMLSSLDSVMDVWVGLVWDQNSLTYKWSSGAPVTYTKWVNRQPDPYSGGYVKVGVRDNGVEPMLWKPAQMDEKLPFFCQRKTGLFFHIFPPKEISLKKKFLGRIKK